jgi:chromosome segregation ATPase
MLGNGLFVLALDLAILIYLYFPQILAFVTPKLRALKAYLQTFTITTELAALKATNTALEARIKRFKQQVKEKEDDSLDLTMALKRKSDELRDMTVFLDERRDIIKDLNALLQTTFDELHDALLELADTREMLDDAHVGLQAQQRLVADQNHAIEVAMDIIREHGLENERLRGVNEGLRGQLEDVNGAMERGESVAVVVPVRGDV